MVTVTKLCHEIVEIVHEISTSGRTVSPEIAQLRAKLAREGSLVLDIKVIPRARSSEVCGVMANGALKVKVRAAPERGNANQEVCAVLSEYLGLPKNRFEVIAGWTSPQKRVRAQLV